VVELGEEARDAARIAPASRLAMQVL